VPSRRLRSNSSRRAARRRLQTAVATIILAAVLVAGFYLGQLAAYSGMGMNPEHYRPLRSTAPKSLEEVAALQSDFDQLQTRSNIDHGALGMLREEIARQNEVISDQEEGLRFYRELMAPEEIAQGLILRPPEIVAREGEGRFEFRLVALQEARKHETLRGELYVEVFGRENGETVSYPLADLSVDIKDKMVSLGFRYFQAIEGIIVLPAGFEPLSMNVIATAKTPRKVEVKEQYPWQVQERFTHAGK
jgi:hypothetical protein